VGRSVSVGNAVGSGRDVSVGTRVSVGRGISVGTSVGIWVGDAAGAGMDVGAGALWAWQALMKRMTTRMKRRVFFMALFYLLAVLWKV